MQDLIAIYRDLAARCDYPLHLGLTEAGMGSKGIVASTAGMAVLLQEGIGDTIRVSLTPEPDGDRTQEVIVAQEILQTMGLRAFTPHGGRLPGLRAHHQHLLPGARAAHPGAHLRHRMPQWRARVRRRRGDDAWPSWAAWSTARARASTPTSASACRAPASARWRRCTRTAQKTVTLKGERIAEEFQDLVEQYVARRYARRGEPMNELASRASASPVTAASRR